MNKCKRNKKGTLKARTCCSKKTGSTHLQRDCITISLDLKGVVIYLDFFNQIA